MGMAMIFGMHAALQDQLDELNRTAREKTEEDRKAVKEEEDRKELVRGKGKSGPQKDPGHTSDNSTHVLPAPQSPVGETDLGHPCDGRVVYQMAQRVSLLASFPFCCSAVNRRVQGPCPLIPNLKQPSCSLLTHRFVKGVERDTPASRKRAGRVTGRQLFETDKSMISSDSKFTTDGRCLP